jgi:hypothetical protein
MQVHYPVHPAGCVEVLGDNASVARLELVNFGVRRFAQPRIDGALDD